MEENKKTLLREVIDIGSTVSGFGYQLYEKGRSDEWIPCPGCRKTWYVPTVIIEKDKNPDAEQENDLYGNTALEVAKKRESVVSAEFKQYLYNPEGEKYKEAKRLTVKFMAFIRSVLENGHELGKEVYEKTEKEVFITVPLIASKGISDDMIKSAQAAGFTKKNGYNKVEKIDEARSLADIILSDENSGFKRALTDLARHPEQHQTVMFIDIGGLTIDINLALVSYDREKDYTFKQIGIWPQASDRKGVNSLGGGITLDMALRDYLEKNGFINPEASDKSVRMRGYMDFREFKEYANDIFWKYGKAPDRLNGLGMDPDDELFPEKDYKEEKDRHLTPDLFIREVAADYISTIIEGIRKAVRDGSEHKYVKEAGMSIGEESIDWIFITGGGSSIFFMKDMLTGNLPDCIDNLNLEKIKNEPERIIGLDAENKTLGCVHGGLIYTGKFILSAVSDYDIELKIYPKYVFKTVKKPIYREVIPIMKKGDILPTEIPFETYIDFTYSASLSGLEVEMNLLQNNMEDISKKEKLGKISGGKTNMSVIKDAGNALWTTAKAGAVPAAAAAAGSVLNALQLPAGDQLLDAGRNAWAKNQGGIKTKTNKFYDSLDFARSHKESLHLKGSFAVDGNRVLTGTVSVDAESIKENKEPLTVTLD